MRQIFITLPLLFIFVVTVAQDTVKTKLTDSVYALKEVSITTSKQAIAFQPGKTVLKVAGNRAFATSANVMDILRKAPGILLLADGQLQLSGNPPVVFINGKPSELPASEVQAYLGGLNPDDVESVELIPNPPAKYDGQYKAIIDIRLKNATDGWSGNLGTSLRKNVYFSADNNLNLAYRRGKAVFNLLAGYVAGKDYYRYTAFQRLASGTYLSTNTIRATELSNPRVQLLATYPISEKQDLDISLRAFWGNRDLVTNNTLEFRPELNLPLSGFNQTQTLADPRQRNYSANLNYTLRLDTATRLNIFASGSTISNRQREDIQIRNALAGVRSAYWKTDLANQLDLYSFQADLTKGSWEAGVKFATSSTRNDLRYDTLNTAGVFALDSGRTNQFNYREFITAGYASYQKKFNKVGLTLSLRAEQTRTRAESVTTGEIKENSYWTLLPSVLVSYEQWALTITRRLTRPGFDQLNPFRFYLSPLNYWVGNPYLRAAVTSLANLAYTRDSWNINLTVAREHHMLTRYPEYDRVTNALLYLGANLPYRDYAILESSYSFNLNKWWRFTNTLALYYNKQQMPYLGNTYAIPVRDLSYAGSQAFSLPRGWVADVSYRYQSKSGSSLYIQQPYGSLDLGIRKKWLNGRLTSRLNAYDLFYTQITDLTFREKSIIDNRLTHRSATRRVVLSLQYDLGRTAYKAKAVKTSDEEKRVAQ